MGPLRSLRSVCAACALLLAVALTPGAPPAEGAVSAAYAALGDSYSAGLGAGAYLDESGHCRRSAHAYPDLWATRHAPPSFAFAACSGATAGDVLDGQLDVLGPSTRVVSITVGGNDVGFSKVMVVCLLSSDARCLRRVAQARSSVETTLPGLLDRLYSATRAKAPAARVVVMGYPRPYRLDSSCRVGPSQAKRAAIDQAADDLDTVIARRAEAYGFAFGDVRAAFEPHEICSTRLWWLHGVTYPAQESYHPTAEGQVNGYLPVFAAQAGG